MVRKILVLLLTGPFWWVLILLFFVYSGAQTYLASPEHQSEKFLQIFIQEPLPRMVQDPYFIWTGMWFIGLFPAAVFLYLNNKLKGMWWQKGLKYSMIHFALVTPWFEFYLPYNVMHEPIELVLLESLLWLAVATILGLFISFLVNINRKKQLT